MSIEALSSLTTKPFAAPSAAGGAGKSAEPRSAGATPAPDFAAMLAEAVTGLGQQLRQAEAVSLAAMKGLASTQEVVEQVTAAEQALQASIAVRDKIVAAYLEISRMAI